MQDYAPSASKLPREFWLNLVTSLIAQTMIDSFDPGNFFGLTSKRPVASAKELTTAFEGLCLSTNRSQTATNLDLAANVDAKWVTATRKLLVENAKEALEMSDRGLAETLSKMVRSELHYAVSLEWTKEIHERLTDIFKRGQEFYRLIYTQQSHLRIIMPMAKLDGQAQPFVPEEMEVVNGGMEDETALAGSPIEISVFPAVYKMGASASTSVSILLVRSRCEQRPTDFLM